LFRLPALPESAMRNESAISVERPHFSLPAFLEPA
jgi:hypothetical protein